MTIETDATLAPPILSGRWPNATRAAMNAAANAVIPSQIGVHPLAANSSVAKVVIAPKLRLLKVSPIPGTETAASTIDRRGWGRSSGGTERSRRFSGNTASGPSVVASPIAKSPWAGIEGGSGGGADGKRRVERRPEPGDDLSRVLRIDEAEAPSHRAGDDEAFRAAEQRAAEQEDHDRRQRRVQEPERQDVEQPRSSRRAQPGDDRALGAAPVGVAARPDPRNQRCPELAAGDEADDEGAQPQLLKHMQWQRRYRQTGDQKQHQNDRYQRQQRGPLPPPLPARKLGSLCPTFGSFLAALPGRPALGRQLARPSGRSPAPRLAGNIGMDL